MASFTDTMLAEIEGLFSNVRQGAFLEKQTAVTPYEGAIGPGQINPTGFVEDKGIEEVVSLSWIDFINSNFYNSSFSSGTLNDITAATLVGSASTVADYLNSISVDLPYWVVASETGAGTFQRVADATAQGGFALQWSGTETAKIFQDIPISPGRRHRIYIQWRYTAPTATFNRTIGTQYREEDHSAIGSVVESGLAFGTDSISAYQEAELALAAAAPANARYLRVSLEIARSTGSPIVWLNSIRAEESLLGTVQIDGDATGIVDGKIAFQNIDSLDSIIEGRVSGEAANRFVLQTGGRMRWGDGTADANKGVINPPGNAFPGGPTTNTRMFRNDLGYEFYYNGSVWIPTNDHTVSEAYLVNDVDLTNANTAYDGPSLSLTAGSYLILARMAAVVTNAGGGYINIRLLSGATVIAEGGAFGLQFVENHLTVFGFVSLTSTTTVKIQGISNSAGNDMRAETATNGTADRATHIMAIKLKPYAP